MEVAPRLLNFEYSSEGAGKPSSFSNREEHRPIVCVFNVFVYLFKIF